MGNERSQVPIEKLSSADLERRLIETHDRLKIYGVTSPLASLIFDTIRGAEGGLPGFEQLPDNTGSFLVTAHNLKSAIELVKPDHFSKLGFLEAEAAGVVLAEISTVYNRLNLLSRQQGKDYQFPRELIFPQEGASYG